MSVNQERITQAIINRQMPVVGLDRMMVFVDGENMIFRFQDILKKGRQMHPAIAYLEDTFVWCAAMTALALNHNVVRATYYTYSTGDDVVLDSIRDRIRELTFLQNRFSSLPNSMTPFVLKKTSKSAKAKGVDVQMCIDILHHATHDNYDAALILSGDGDFVPLIHEVVRAGKQVFIAAFSSGLNKELPRLANRFELLDGHAFVAEQDQVPTDERKGNQEQTPGVSQ